VLSKALNFLIKLPIYAISRLLSYNKDVLKYLFSVALKKEVTDYYDHNYYHGYAHIEKAIILSKKLGDKKGFVLDVGGADGTTAGLFLNGLPDSKIMVFEPIMENYRQIEESLKGKENIILIKKAAGSKNDSGVINRASRITSSSLYTLNPDKSSGVFSSDLEMQGQEKIEVVTIDSVVPAGERIKILKLDVQGYELEVLKGAGSALSRTDIIVTEVNNHNVYVGAPKYFELDEFLRSRGFILYDLFPSTKDDGRLKEWDAIYVKE
jgi:FkbM family methyltransferase